MLGFKRGLTLNRRKFLKLGYNCATTAATGCLFPRLLLAKPSRSLASKRLSFYSLHTGESLKITYAVDGKYIPDALHAIDHILRDHRTGEIKAIDNRLLDLLHTISHKIELKARHSFHIISGYRSVQTNAMLQKKGRGVVKNSYHIKGQAVDFRVPPFRLAHLQKVALRLQAGGVGYYPRSNFLHVDVGKFRYW
jgi:uncharacterized protein YcbK (DUF882 family)